MSNVNGYNGYSNYETWLMSMWLNNDQLTYYMLEEIKAAADSAYAKAVKLEEMVREQYTFEPVGLIADFINAALGRVDWAEIVGEQ